MVSIRMYNASTTGEDFSGFRLFFCTGNVRTVLIPVRQLDFPEDIMKEYTYTEARQQLASLLDMAVREGEVRIRRRDGQIFTLRPETSSRSPLDVPGIDTDLTIDEINVFIREERSRYGADEESGKGGRP
jgi:antitoxin Phd